MTIVARIEIMEERMAMAKLAGQKDVAEFYRHEIKKLEIQEREEKVRA